MAIQYVGGVLNGRAGATTTTNQSLTALTGGIGSAPQAGDLVLVYISIGTAAGYTPSNYTPSGYASIGAYVSVGAANYTYTDTAWKFMTSTPDTSVTIPSSGNARNAQSWAIQVFRGVDPTFNPFYAHSAAAGSASGRPNPAAITPSTAGSWITYFGASAAATGAAYTAPTGFATNWLSRTTADTYDSMIGAGYYTGWTSGSYDPAAITEGGTTNSADTWVAVAIALKPEGGSPYTLDSSPGSYSTSGAAATTIRSRISSLNSTSFSLTGAISSTLKGFLAATTLGAFAVTGLAAEFEHVATPPAESGEYAVSGFSANILRAAQFNVAASSYALQGAADTSLSYSFAINAEQGAISYAGVEGNLCVGWQHPALARAFTTTGFPSFYVKTNTLLSASAEYTITEYSPTLEYSKNLLAYPHTYTLTGVYAALESFSPNIPGIYQVIGREVTFLQTHFLPLSPQPYEYGLLDPLFSLGSYIVAEHGSLTYSGFEVDFNKTRYLHADAGFTWDDPLAPYVTLLMNFNGPNGAWHDASYFPDETGRNIPYAWYNPWSIIYGAVNQWPELLGNMAYFGQEFDNLGFGVSDSFYLGSDPFCMEVFHYPMGHAARGNIFRVPGYLAVFDSWVGSSIFDPTANHYCVIIPSLNNGYPILIDPEVHEYYPDDLVHFAIVRNGDTLSMYIGGIEKTSYELPAGFVINPGPSSFVIGSDAGWTNASAYHFMNDFRLTRGHPRYTENFTPPRREMTYDKLATYLINHATELELPLEAEIVKNTNLITEAASYEVYGEAAGIGLDWPLFAETDVPDDIYLANRILYIPFDGEDGSTKFFDVHGKIITTVGNVRVSNPNPSSGLSRGYFDGNGSYLSVPTSIIPQIRSSPLFALAAVIHITNMSGFVGRGNPILDSSCTSTWCENMWYVSPEGAIIFYRLRSPAITIASANGVILPNTTYRVSLESDGVVWRIRVDGVIVASAPYTDLWYAGEIKFTIGRAAVEDYPTTYRYFIGYIDEVAFYSGISVPGNPSSFATYFVVGRQAATVTGKVVIASPSSASLLWHEADLSYNANTFFYPLPAAYNLSVDLELGGVGASLTFRTSDGIDPAVYTEYSIIGNEALLVTTGIIQAEAKQFVITGAEASLAYDIGIKADPFTITLFPNANTTLRKQFSIQVQQASYNVVGSMGSLDADHPIDCNTGSYEILGHDGIGTYDAFTFPESYLLTHHDVDMQADYPLDAQTILCDLIGYPVHINLNGWAVNAYNISIADLKYDVATGRFVKILSNRFVTSL
jgi:hypothetical protein